MQGVSDDGESMITTHPAEINLPRKKSSITPHSGGFGSFTPNSPGEGGMKKPRGCEFWGLNTENKCRYKITLK